MKLSIIIPAHNEQDNIVDVIHRIESFLDMPYELIVVNDHSTDATPVLVESVSRQYSNIRLVENLNERGFANAIKTGFVNSKADVVVPVMADLCDDLHTIKEMFKKINEGHDVVCGARYIKGGARMGGSKIKGFFFLLCGMVTALFIRNPRA